MPAITRWYVRTSLVYLAAGLAAGVLQALQPQFAGLFPVYLHVLVFGWLTQLIMGIALWMFPKYTRDRPRRSDRMSWAAYLLLNTGMALRLAGEPLQALQPGSFSGWLLVGSAALQWLAGTMFIWNIWPRVKVK